MSIERLLRDVLDPMILRRGDQVTITYNDQTIPAMVTLASPNGVSLAVMFDGVLRAPSGGAFIGYMLILKEGDDFTDLIEGEEVIISRRP